LGRWEDEMERLNARRCEVEKMRGWERCSTSELHILISS
jgi:hypothetical protein